MSVVSLKGISGITSITNAAGASDVLTFHSNNTTERARITSGGNFGIGTNNPQRLLHLQSTSDALLRVTAADGNIAYIELGDVSDPDGGKIAHDASSNTRFYTQSLERLCITSAGRVGINSSVPQANLDVQGGEVYYHSGTNNNLGIKLSYSNGNSTGIIDTYGNHPLEVRVNNSERLRIGTGGSGASIGINTTANLVTNSERLIVRGFSSFKSTSKDYSAIYVASEGNTSGSPNQLLMWNDGGANRGGIGYVPNTGELRFNNQYYMTFCTGASTLGGTERFRIDSNGNITQGIEASATFSAINSISANAARGIEIHKNGTDTGSAIKLAGDNGSGTKAWSQLGYSGANATAHWANYNTSGTKLGEIIIGSTGNIGIGESSPDTILEINKGSEGRYLKIGGDDATNGRALTFTSSATTNSVNGGRHTIDATSAHGQIEVATGGTPRVRITPTGFMGPLARTGSWQGTYVYKQQNQSANYEHKIRGPLSGYLDTEMDSNSVAYIKVQCLGTGINNSYCYYRWSQDGENAGATLTHIHGNSGNSSNRPWLVLDGQHACWKTAHATQYNYIIRVEITGGDDGDTFSSTGSYAAN